MDEILASIRRILSDEEKVAKAKAPNDGVLHLDSSMLVDGPATDEPSAPSTPPPNSRVANSRVFDDMMGEDGAVTPVDVVAVPTSERNDTAPTTASELLAPETAASAATSVGALMRTLAAERSAVIYRGGPSIEDLVREEIRPLLKGWLDAHLPGLVERLVRAEIERVVGRVTG